VPNVRALRSLACSSVCSILALQFHFASKTLSMPKLQEHNAHAHAHTYTPKDYDCPEIQGREGISGKMDDNKEQIAQGSLDACKIYQFAPNARTQSISAHDRSIRSDPIHYTIVCHHTHSTISILNRKKKRSFYFFLRLHHDK